MMMPAMAVTANPQSTAVLQVNARCEGLHKRILFRNISTDILLYPKWNLSPLFIEPKSFINYQANLDCFASKLPA